MSNNEKCFLRLFVLNYNDRFILDFLEIKKKKLNNIKNTLKKKFDTKDWDVLIRKAFKIGILEERDYVDSAIKEIALDYAAKIVSDIKAQSNRYKLSKDILLDFDNATVTLSQKQLKSTFNIIEPHQEKVINDKELNYLRLTFEGMVKPDIAEKLQFISKKEHTELEQSILNKYSVNNLYNAYRRAFNLQLLNREEFMTADIKEEASIFCEKIMEILSSIITDKEKELKIHLELLTFHMKIEYSYLLKR